jgi:hypothetical protein
MIGLYVVDMIQGELNEEMEKRWAWDRPSDGGALPAYAPRRDLKDIQGYNQSPGRRLEVIR